MKRKLIACCLVLHVLLFALLVNAQNISDVFQDRVQLTFSFPIQNDTIMRELTQIISIDNVQHDRVYAIASKQQFEAFIEYGIEYQVELTALDIYPHEDWVMTEDYTNKEFRSWNTYPTYNAYIQMMQQFAADFPHLCRLDTIGYSVQNRLLLSLQISNNPGVAEDKPDFLYTSTMHGDETVGFVLMLRLIDTLLHSYGVDERLTHLVDNIKICINPNANPDGTYFGGNNTVTGAIRYNANMIDLNRNYPDFVGGQFPSGAWQAETKAFMNYAHTHNFVMSANFHGGIELMNYPWDVNDLDNHADRLWWRYVCKEYADTAQLYSPSGYFDEVIGGSTIPGVTNGGQWYIVYGGRQDYMNYYHHCREVTAEISDEKNPPSAQLPAFWEWNYRSLLNYMEQVLYGIRGVVTDACSGQPIRAKIELLSHDVDNSFVYSALPVGNYHRLVKAGTYNMKVSAPGYQDVIIQQITVADKQTVFRNVEMFPEMPQADFSVISTDICNGFVAFTNTSVTSNGSSYYWNFGDMNNSDEYEPIHQYLVSGTYNVALIVQNCTGKDTIVKANIIQIEVLSPPLIENIEKCQSDYVTFTAISDETVYWWDASGNNVLHIGDTFVTPILFETTSYMVSNVRDNLVYTGKSDTTGTNYIATLVYNNNGIVFDAHAQMKLLTVDMYAKEEISTIVQLRNENNTIIASSNVDLVLGKNTIELHFDIAAGNNYKLICVNADNMYCNDLSGTSNGYPFHAGNIMTITRSTSAEDPHLSYYFFYNVLVEKNTLYQGAQTNRTTNGAYLTTSNVHGLVFSSNKEVVLESVKVYANQAGNRTITLIDEGNNILQSANVFIPSGESRIDLHFQIPAQENLILLGGSSPNLWRDGGQTAPMMPYPYQIGDFITIHANTANNLRYYYYFYDWLVSNEEYCESPKIPVIAYIHNEPVPFFSYEENQFTVNFTNLSTGGGVFEWNFGDGNSSYEANPLHTYENPDIYTVQLTQSNACGIETYTEVITITSVNVYTHSNNFVIFPNPTYSILNIESSNMMYKLEIIDIHGRSVLTDNANQTNLQLQTSDLPNGLYFIKIHSSEGVYHSRFIKM